MRTEKLIGQAALELLNTKKVAVFGLGGVGSFAAESIARSGVGFIDIYDYDIVAKSNINRQLIALDSTVGLLKTQVMYGRIKDINPECNVNAFGIKYTPENAALYPLDKYDYVIDAIDTVTSKLELVVRAKAANVPIISSMGTGNKLHANFFIDDIYKTSVCPLARVMRRELKTRGIENLDVLYSQEPPIVSERVPASISFVPPVAGLLIAGHVVRKLIGML